MLALVLAMSTNYSFLTLALTLSLTLTRRRRVREDGRQGLHQVHDMERRVIPGPISHSQRQEGQPWSTEGMIPIATYHEPAPYSLANCSGPSAAL